MLQLDAARRPRGHRRRTSCAGSILHASPRADARGHRPGRAAPGCGIPLLTAEDCIHGHSFWPGATIFPTQLGDGLHLGRRPARAGRPGDRGRGRRDRHPLDLLPGAVHRPRPALGPGQRDVRRGPVPDRRAGRGDGARLPGRRPDRPDRDPGHAPSTSPATPRPRAAATPARPTSARASCARGSCRRSSGWPARAAAPSCSATSRSTACRSPRTSGCSTTCSSGEWGFTGTLVTDWDNVGRMVWEQHVCADYAEAAAVAVEAGNDLVMTTPRLLRGRAGGGRARACSTRTRSTTAVRRILRAEVRARPVREPARPRRRAAGRGDRLPPSTPTSTSRWPAARWCCCATTAPALAGLTADGRRAAAGTADDRGHRPERRRPARPARRLGRRLRPGRLDARRPPPRDDRDGARRLPRRRARRTGRSPTPAAPTSSTWSPTRRAPFFPTASPGRRSPGRPGRPGAARRGGRRGARPPTTPSWWSATRIALTGEGRSTATLELQGGQVALLDALAATGTPTDRGAGQLQAAVLPPSALERGRARSRRSTRACAAAGRSPSCCSA